MKKQHTHAADAALLRQKAEEQLKLQQSYSGSLSAKTNIPNLLHELQVHQIELQMQNEELIVAKEKAELAQIKYSDIYSFAPIGILTLTEEGIISELNFVATGMLGKERSILVNKWFAIFVSDDTKATFRETLNKALNSRQKQSADITLIVDGKEPLIVHFSCIQIETTRHYLITLVDITERIQALEKLKESEEKYHLLFENMISGFQLNEVIVDENNIPVDFRIIDGNTNLQQYTGYSIEESRGKTIKEMMPDADIEMIKRYGNVALTGEPFNLEYFSNTFKHWFIVRAYSPKKGYFACIFSNITERKQNEKALLESEIKYKNLVRDAQVGLLIQGPKAEMLLNNQKALDLLGLTEDQLLGKTSFDPYWNVIHEDGSPFPGPTHPVVQAIETKKTVANIVMGVFRPTIGDRIWLLVSATPQLNNNGNVEQVVCSFIDITQQIKAEQTLHASKDYLDKIINSVASPIFVKNEKYEYCLVNDAFCKLLNLPAEKLIGKTDFDHLPEELANKFNKIDQEVFEFGRENNNDDRFTDAAGILRHLYTIKTLYTDSSGNKFLVGVANDITELKNIELDLKTETFRLNKTMSYYNNREVRMIDLKKEVNELCLRLGEEKKYENW